MLYRSMKVCAGEGKKKGTIGRGETESAINGSGHV